MPMNSAFDAHGGGLSVGNEAVERMLVGAIHDLRAVEALLALALLHEEVVTAVAIERQLAASGSTDTLLRAAVGLQFRHTVTAV